MRFNLSFPFTFTIEEKNFDAILQNLSRIDACPTKDIIHHSLHLFRQGLSYSDLFDKFFTLWRSFNSLYNHFHPTGHESTRIRETLKRLDTAAVDDLVNTYSDVSMSAELTYILRNHQKNLFNYLATAGLIDDHRNNRSQELADALNSGNHEDILRNATFCFYVLQMQICTWIKQCSNNAKPRNVQNWFIASFNDTKSSIDQLSIMV